MSFRTSISEIDELNEDDEMMSNDPPDLLFPMRKEMVWKLLLHDFVLITFFKLIY